MIWRKYLWLIICTILAALINAATWGVLYYYLPRTTGWIALQYNIYMGISLTGEWYRSFYIAGSGTICLLINTIIAGVVWPKTKLLSYCLMVSNILIQIILLVAAGLIVYNNMI
ncbi:MAG: hypothetical protein WCW27_02915 [Patescibacteria group bacterium]|jgi:hypothetical protein